MIREGTLSRFVAGRLAGCACTVAIGLAACAGYRPAASSEAPAPGPVITAITPASGPAGTAYPVRAIIEGRGFAETGNVVRFGTIAVPDRPSTDGGTRILFSVPKAEPSTSEVPPMVLPAGDYPVTVTTPEGTSNAMTFTLTRPRRP